LSLYPLKFKPRLLEKMWGGRKIQTVLGQSIPHAKNIGESWELFDFPPGLVDDSTDWISAEVSHGPLAGKTLHQLVGEFGADLYGSARLVAPHGQFPILIKFLDAKEDLSIQVHPDRKYAANHAGAYLKSEAWYIVQSDPGARLYKGLKPGVTATQFKDSIHQGHCEKLLNQVPVKAGDCYYLPSGTVHAVGAGILAAEVQTPSDTTFRVYDFNRIEASTGKPRKLHVEQALACIHFADQAPEQAHPTPQARWSGIQRRIVNCEFFNIDEIRLTKNVKQPLQSGQPIVWMMLEGKAQVSVTGLPSPIPFARGETILLPASMNHPVLETFGPCLWLEVTLPPS
jgi:mannose-6-phosphate isomerase